MYFISIVSISQLTGCNDCFRNAKLCRVR